MKAKKLICFLALPLMLVTWVGCSKDNAEEKKTDNVKVEDHKKTDSVQDAESKDKAKTQETIDVEKNKEQKVLETETKDKNQLAKEEVKQEVKEEVKEEVKQEVKEEVKEEVKQEVKQEEIKQDKGKPVLSEEEKAHLTLAELREYEGNQVFSDVKPPVTISQFKEEIRTQSKKFMDAVEGTKTIIEKDKTLKTNKEELRKQYEVVKEQADKVTGIKAPTDYSYFKDELIDEMKIIVPSLNGLFIGLDTNDEAKTESSKSSLNDGLDYFKSTLNEIEKLEQ
ncbi:hypothetical protein ABEX41_14635 [Bacillus tropicus]|uniref:Lipoprotein n=2 Tax=Bacillaceae TaxID=186817 RepID=A0A5C5A9R4_9BACI|nr:MULTISPECIES: hypothetical protein [Bacillus]ALL20071.1 hypothetical protein BTXL6_00920 [Bacillus thuringiensis]EEM21397.1 Mature parasite-infected erythrocyte surface antigen (MESA) or PfEMP2 [Bacillus thuringiensis serovar tochigiensis BGSC 4Y1]MDA1840135.1 hypothetical protein [Bacillus cereus group sp. BY17LC]TNP16657.1 hypothetical protein FHY71_09265 [Bacillus tropicus]UBM49782.1 hypothetical protein K8M08_22830 [Bacillus sp. CRB-7]